MSQKKERLVDQILNNSSKHCWSADDRPWLMTRSVEFLQGQVPVTHGGPGSGRKPGGGSGGNAISDRAEEASAKAEKSGSTDDHKEAFFAHMAAAAHHGEEGNGEEEKDHIDQAQHHAGHMSPADRAKYE